MEQEQQKKVTAALVAALEEQGIRPDAVLWAAVEDGADEAVADVRGSGEAVLGLLDGLRHACQDQMQTEYHFETFGVPSDE